MLKPRLIHPQNPLPSDEAIRAVLESAGLPIKQDDRDAVYRKMLALLDDVDILREDFMLRLFADAQIRKGRAFTIGQLKGIAQPNDEIPRFYTIVQGMVNNGIFRRGYALGCPYCETSQWYDLPEFAEHLICRDCGAVFQPPLDLPFAYKPNVLFVKGLKNGALTVLLTLRYFYKSCPALIWGAGYQVGMDVDLIVMCGDALHMLECKDSLHAHDLPRIREQIQQGVSIARRIGADFYVASMDDVPDFLLGDSDSVKTLNRDDLLA